MNTCDRLKQHLIKHGRQSVHEHRLLSLHLHECHDCKRLLNCWTRIPGLLDELPRHDPDEAQLQSILNTVSSQQQPANEAWRMPKRATALASVAVLLTAIGLSRQMFENGYPPVTPVFKQEYEEAYVYEQEAMKRAGELTSGPLGEDPREYNRNDREASDDENSRFRGQEIPGRTEQLASLDALVIEALPEQDQDGFSFNQPKIVQSPPPTVASTSAILAPAKSDLAGSGGNLAVVTPDSAEDRQRLNKEEAGKLADLGDEKKTSDKPKLTLSESVAYEAINESYYRDEMAQRRRSGQRELPQSEAAGRSRAIKQQGGYQPEGQRPHGQKTAAVAEPDLRFGFLDNDQSIEQLQFQPSDGYWANTHVPGDPAIRLLKARLNAWDRSGLGEQLRLEQDVTPVSQPFDAPADSALALSVMSDANAVEGATRMRLQVGIRGIEHRRGQRPAMNMGVVIDLPPDADDASRIGARALLEAVLASKQPGDRFSLVISGSSGLVVPPEDFRFGPLQLARQAIIDGGQSPSDGQRDLSGAIHTATDLVRQTDDPSLPLGSSSILLISADSLNDIERLSAQVHRQARDGITLSVVPLGSRTDSHEVEQLVLAGLGSRRILQAPDQARQLVEAELHSSSRAVARAARLSVRLAEGVRLIDILGSTRLDTERSQRVRDIENSMDRRLSANLGIRADRGEDEDGIQIVIPSIFSGDDVTVLLDVLVDRPGDIASVSLRYKDLVYQRNGKLSGQLSLPAGPLQRGPAENAVVRSVLAHHFSAAAGHAADALGRNQGADALAILSNMRSQIVSLRQANPAFQNDPDLLRDEQILNSYITVLGSSGTHQPELADSLRYAAWAKAHRPPAEWKQ